MILLFVKLIILIILLMRFPVFNKKKIWIDVENKSFAKDGYGNFLSNFEFYDNFKLGNEILLYFLKNDLKVIKIDSSSLFKKSAFDFLVITNVNDVVHVDKIVKSYNFLP